MFIITPDISLGVKAVKAFAYTRVSTDRQSDDGLSLPEQAERIKLHCQLKGWTLVKTFVERGATATRLSGRPKLERAMEAVCASQGVLVFFDLSRLARNLWDAVSIERRLRDAGAHFAAVNEPWETATPTGRLLFHFLAAIAEWDSGVKGEKIAASNRRTISERGHRTNGSQPAGYKLKNGRRVVCKREAEVIEIARTLSDQLGFAEAARKMASDGVPTIATLRGYKRKSSWNRQLVRDLVVKAPAGSAPHGVDAGSEVDVAQRLCAPAGVVS
jgi:site-specific DNA recombinase